MTEEYRGTASTLNKIGMAVRSWPESLKGSLGALGRQHAGKATRGERQASVGRVVKDLEALNGLTEHDFLIVGEKLAGFRAMARQIVSDFAALSELISGEQSHDASQALVRTLEQSRGMDARIEASGSALGEVRDLSRRIRVAFAGLRNTVSVFRTLCTLTRIETSRLGNTTTDFGDLAAEVLPLSESIQRSGEGVLASAALLDESVQGAIQRGNDLRQSQLRELPGLISNLTAGLQAFEERRMHAVESSVHQVAEYKTLCQAIDDVVSSVQFHDITRQQVEHVLCALRPLGRRSGVETVAPGETRAILTLQAAQLSRAAGSFASSIKNMERELASIATRGQAMAEACRKLMGVSGDEQGSFFVRMEGHFTSILNMLGKCTAAQAEMEGTSGQLQETISRMRGSVGEIRGVEIGIQRIAINATIRATHIGDAGDALNVIAEVMQRLALDSNANTEDVGATLNAMSEAVTRVAGGSPHETSIARAGANEAMEEMRGRVLELHASSESTFCRVEQIAALSARLAEDISALRSSLTAGKIFADVVQGARKELERLGAQCGDEPGRASAGASTGQLDNLAKSYTMQTQREVHESVVRGAAGAEPETATATATLDADDLGDNIDFF